MAQEAVWSQGEVTLERAGFTRLLSGEDDEGATTVVATWAHRVERMVRTRAAWR